MRHSKMKHSIAGLGFLCLVGHAMAFLPAFPHGPPTRVEMPVKVISASATQLSALPSFEGQDNKNVFVSIEKQIKSAVVTSLVASFIVVSSLGLVLPSPEPAFAAAAPTTQVVQATTVPKEVAAVESAKDQVAAATRAILDAKTVLADAQLADRAAAKELYNAEKNLEGIQKNAEVAKARLKSMKTNSKEKDVKGISSAQAQVAETNQREKEAQSRYDVAKKVSSQAKDAIASKQSAIQKATQGKGAAEMKLKAANDKLVQYKQKAAEADKKAQKAAQERVKGANEKAKADAQKQKEKEKAAIEKAKVDAKKQNEKDAAAKQKAAEKAKNDAEKAKQAAAKLKEKEAAAQKKAAENAKKDAEKAKQAREQARKTTAKNQSNKSTSPKTSQQAAKKSPVASQQAKTKAPTASQQEKKTPPKAKETTMTKGELNQAIQEKELEVKRISRKKISLEGSKGASREDVSKVAKQLETAMQELEKLKAVKK